MHVGDVFKGGRYVVLSKLGWGHFSTVWLASDTHSSGQEVALKVQKSASHYTEAAYDEIEILRQIQAGDQQGEHCVVRLLDSFEHAGPHGTHVCMIFEKLGDNLLTLIKHHNYRGVPLDVVRHIARQVLIGLDYLHRERSIIHTDLKPENVLLKHHLPPRPGRRSSAAGTSQLLPRPPPVATSKPKPPPSPLTKNQKKKLKRKAKKASHGAGPEDGAGAAPPPAEDNGDGEGDCDASDEEEEGDEDEGGTGSASPDGGDTRGGAGRDPPVPAEADDGPHGRGAESFEPTAAEVEAAAAAASSGDTDARGGDTGSGASADAWLCKIVDLGNACWTYKQFTADIQTRQYRCPEVLLGAKYSTPADMWSMACLVFELATGDLLFDPRSGEGYERDEDHLALMIELLGRMPRRVALGGKHSRDFFTRQGELRHIRKLRMWPMDAVLREKYNYSASDAAALADFLVPMLHFVPERRATAAESLQHPWLTGAAFQPRAHPQSEGSSETDEGGQV